MTDANSTESASRPASVVVILVLLWIKALLGTLVGLLLIIERDSDELQGQLSLSSNEILWYGIATVAVAGITALVALGLSGGSRVSRDVVGILMLLWIVAGIYAIAAFSGSARSQGFWQAAIAIVVLYFLYVRADSRTYFRDPT